MTQTQTWIWTRIGMAWYWGIHEVTNSQVNDKLAPFTPRLKKYVAKATKTLRELYCSLIPLLRSRNKVFFSYVSQLKDKYEQIVWKGVQKKETSLILISKNQPGVQRSHPLKSSPGSHSPLVNSDSVGIMSSCSLLVSLLSVGLALSRLRCICFSVSISNL